MSEFGMVSETIESTANDIQSVGSTLTTIRDIGHGVCAGLGAVTVILPVSAPVTGPIIACYEGDLVPILNTVIDVCATIEAYLRTTWQVVDAADNAAKGNWDALSAQGVQAA